MRTYSVNINLNLIELMAEIKPKLLLPFSNPVLAFDFPYNKDFRTSLIQECYEYRKHDESINLADAHRQVGWQSKKILFNTQAPSLRRIAQFVLNAVTSMSKTISPNINMANFNLGSEGWININQQGSLHFPHTHGNTTFSGVFYVKVPDATKPIYENDINKPGFIEFLDPRNDVSGFARGIKELKDSLSFKQQMLIAPEEGRLLIFPAWLKHWVYPNIENEERISISFNSSLLKKK